MGALKHVVGLGLLVLATALFHRGSVLEGKSLNAPDHYKASGMGWTRAEQFAKEAPAGEWSAWSDAMFGGMPYGPGYGSATIALPSFRWVEVLVSWIGWDNAGMTLAGMVSFYILLCVLGVPLWGAVGGGMAYGLSTYNIIVIAAGHVVKAYAIGYMPLVVAGFFLLFKGRYLWGSTLFIVGLSLSIATSHLQIVYYLMLLSVFLWAGLMVESKREVSRSAICGLLWVGVMLSVAPNALRMYTDWDLSKQSIRGPSELKVSMGGEVKEVSGGLDKDYAFQWSYGRMELLNLVIPNALGGESGGRLGADTPLGAALKVRGVGVPKDGIQSYTYWGDKPFTSGPAYVGAVVAFMGILGFVLVRSRVKWWLLGGGVLLVLMSLGRNLDWFNSMLFAHLPLYNKFRTVEMALVGVGLLAPLGAFVGLRELVGSRLEVRRARRALWISAGIVGGLGLVVWVLPGWWLSFRSPLDGQMLAGLPEWYVEALEASRRGLAASDAGRTLGLVLVSALAVWVYLRSSRKAVYGACLAIGVSALAVWDLWDVDRRYLNESHYISKPVWETYALGLADKEIHEDKGHYRVLGLVNPWQDTEVSNYHASVGGYHAVKLRRYQELIDRYLGAEHGRLVQSLGRGWVEVSAALAGSRVLNMLNTKYIIYDKEQSPLVNGYAQGNAWCVGAVRVAVDADEELGELGKIDVRTEAVLGAQFGGAVEGLEAGLDSSGVVRLSEYRPSTLVYKSELVREQVVLFSEVYYPGWRAYIDGTEVEVLRANWILRALRVPSGSHEIRFRFEPSGYVAAAQIGSLSGLAILALLVGVTLYSVVVGVSRLRKT